MVVITIKCVFLISILLSGALNLYITDALSLCSFFSLSTLFDFLYSPLLITESNSSGDMTIKEDQIVNLQPK